ncbi:MAG: Succinylglutamate desuccinylase/aspartoacylase [Candidatus Nomurabacteria bacterium GW2011_GWD1_44_10]|nr:MAG: Succinylglutamate desuccinylase/aspartoacylase [Candidatus Nomurabacteria bacterium GW2011_GWD1_44_10]
MVLQHVSFILYFINNDYMTTKYSKQNIKKILESPSPRVLLNVCTHGNERVGLKVAKYFSGVKPLCGTFVINVANEKALEAKKRFISNDLNRSFPGKKNGSHEEKLAYKMKPFIEAFDVVLDVHSTETGMTSSIIITNFTSAMKTISKAISPKRIIYMKATKSSALISSAKLGIGFEYGKDKSKKTYHDTIQSVARVLEYYKMINPSHLKQAKNVIEFYEADSTVAKPDGFKVAHGIKNFVLIKKGSVIGYNTKIKDKIVAKKDFYPVLFGKNSYKSIFGFSSKMRKL